MKIGIDLRPLQEYSRFRGIGTVTYELTKSLVESYPKEQYFFYLYTDLPKPDLPEILNKGKSVGFDQSSKDYVLKGFLSILTRKKLTVSENIDVFLATDPLIKLPKGNFKKIVIFYDIIQLLFTQKYLQTPTASLNISIIKLLKLIRFVFARRILIRNLSEALKADKILAISQTTKNDIISYFRTSEKKISVLQLAASTEYRKIDNIDKKPLINKFNLREQFILYIGGLDYRKNVLNLLKSIAQQKNDFPYQLVIIGKDVSRKGMPEALEIKTFIDKENLWNRVKLIDFVSEDEKIAFYNLATIFVFPSFYEGFGLPVLEAMRCGTPVACSNISTLREVAGEAALYFDPDNTQDIADKINSLLKNENMKKELRKKGLQRSRQFSWEKSAENVYHSFGS